MDCEKINDLEIFENEIEVYINQFCEENQIEDLCKESQNRWNACLMYVRRKVFNFPGALKSKYIYNNTGKDNNIMASNYNAYDYDLLLDLVDYYIYICSKYDKAANQNGFCYFTGINMDTMNAWGKEENKLSPKSSEIVKKLTSEYEYSLECKLATANKNPVGIIAILNRRNGWNMPGVSKEVAHAPLTSSELPKLSEKPIQLTDSSG